MLRRILPILFLMLASVVTVDAQAASADGSGLPVPRFVSLRAGEANMRTGPGEQYPVKWVYQRPGLPLEIIGEYYEWRRVRDWQMTEGWIHSGMLTGRRTVVLQSDRQSLRSQPDAHSREIAVVEEGVVARLLACPQNAPWCELEVDGYKGWMPRADLWGVYAGELVR